MPATKKPFWPAYRKAAASFFAPIGKADGIPENVVSTAEKRLGLKLPILLRQFYLRVGKWSELSRMYHRLLEPDKLRVSTHTLVFFEESQQVVFWGIPLAEFDNADPPVCQANNTKRLKWYPDHARLSDFLLLMLYRNFLDYGEYNGAIGISKKTYAAIDRGWPEVTLHGKNLGYFKIYAQGGQALCVVREGQELSLLAAGRTEEDLLAIGQKLGIVEELCGVESEDDEVANDSP